MQIKVTNIKIDEIGLNKKTFKDFDKCVEYAKLINSDYEKYLPTKPQHRVQFEITKTNSDFANCIRRFLLDEIYVYSMNVDTNEIETNDKFILSDLLKKNIEIIPFIQDLTYIEYKNLNISLHLKNNTMNNIKVCTRDIKVTENNKEIDSDKLFSQNITISILRPNTTLSVKNITITKGCAKKDAGKYCLLSNLSYEIMDVEPIEENKYEKTGISSLVSNPAHFKFGYKTHRNIEPKKIMNLCCVALIDRFNNIVKELDNIKQDTITHFSDLIELETRGDMKLYHFKNEYWTIANIIARYCYLEFTDIKYVCACILHPSIEESIVKIKHDESVKIIKNAIKNILVDINILKDAF